MIRPPLRTKQQVLTLCRSIAPGIKPILVPCHPIQGAPTDQCFPVVANQVSREEGEMMVGWAIWEWPKVMLFAEFHAVWRKENGSVEDVAPHAWGPVNVLFLPDPKRRYEGRQVDNIRMPINRDPRTIRLCHLQAEFFRLTNLGDLADQHGMMSISVKTQEIREEIDRLSAELFHHYK